MCVFRLHNAAAKRGLLINENGKLMKHDSNPVYSGVTLDRTLCYKVHLTKLANKIKCDIILLSKIAGSIAGEQTPAAVGIISLLLVCQILLPHLVSLVLYKEHRHSAELCKETYLLDTTANALAMVTCQSEHHTTIEYQNTRIGLLFTWMYILYMMICTFS